LKKDAVECEQNGIENNANAIDENTAETWSTTDDMMNRNRISTMSGASNVIGEKAKTIDMGNNNKLSVEYGDTRLKQDNITGGQQMAQRSCRQSTETSNLDGVATNSQR